MLFFKQKPIPALQWLTACLRGKQTVAKRVVQTRLTPDRILIVTDQGGQTAWWRADLRTDSLEELQAAEPGTDYEGEFPPAPEQGTILSFSVQDVTAPVAARERRSAILTKFEREEGIKVELLPRKGEAIAFGASIDWIKTYAPEHVIPGPLALHVMLRARAPTRFPSVVGLILQQSHAPLLVLYELRASGQLANVRYVPRAGGQNEIGLALRSYADEHGIQRFDDWETSQVAIFNAADLSQILPVLRAYPVEPHIGPVATRVLWRAALASSATVFAVCLSWAGYASLAAHQAQEALQVEQTRLATAQSQLEGLAAGRLADFVALDRAPLANAVDLAQSVYRSGTQVSLAARQGMPIRLAVELPAGTPATNRLAPAPTGCHRLPLKANANVTTIQAIYECTTRGFDFSALFGATRALRPTEAG